MLLISMEHALSLGIKIGSVQISLTDLLPNLVKKTVSEDGILGESSGMFGYRVS